MSRALKWCALALVAGALVPSAASAETTLRDRLAGLGLACADVTTTDGVSWTRCDGELPTFDGIGLRVTLGVPPGATEALPTVSLFHGWLLGGRQEFLPPSTDGRPHGGFAYHWNVPWFASRGYVAMAPTTRGVAQSCGMSDQDPRCANGHLHLSERDYEVRDAQHLIGTLVDAGVADPDGLIASGGSLGGGMSWLLATSFPWDTPAPGTRTVKLAAAVPHVTWSDLHGALFPNGRATDAVSQNADLARPFGIPKTSTVGGLLLVSRVNPSIPAANAFGQSGRFNEANAAELHSFLSGQAAIAHSGEPYDVEPGPKRLFEAYREKSPYYADEWFEALASGEVEPVPTFAVQGWEDPLFPAVELLQMYRRLRSADPDYPIEMSFGGFGHKNDADRFSDWEQINTAANAFVDEIAGRAEPAARPAVRSFVSQCSPGSAGPHDGESWDALAPSPRVFAGSGKQTTRWVPSDAADVQHDPNAGPLLGDHPICKTEQRTSDPEAAEWSWPVSDGFTTAGLPRLEVDYALEGIDATVIAKLWDVGPDGSRTLVDRGVYRLATLGGDSPRGRLAFKLFGSSWNFQPGHHVQLELSQSDGVAFRPDDLPGSVAFGEPRLTLAAVEP